MIPTLRLRRSGADRSATYAVTVGSTIPSPMPTTSRAAPKSQNVCATAQTSMPAENTVAPPKSSRRAP